MWFKFGHIWSSAILKTNAKASKAMKKWAKNRKEPGRSNALLLTYRTSKFFGCADISIYSSFWYATSPSASRIKELLLQFGSNIRITYNFQIYFDQLLCFEEISMTESHGWNSTLNSTVKPLQTAYNDYKMLIYEKWHHFDAPHHTKS